MFFERNSGVARHKKPRIAGIQRIEIPVIGASRGYLLPLYVHMRAAESFQSV